MNLNPDIFKAYDVRGVYPGEVNEDAARAIGAAFVAYLQAKRIAVSRDMRLSILGRHCHIGRNATVDDGVILGDKSVVTDYSRL